MSNADKLREMVTGFTETATNLSGSLVKIDLLIADLTEQWHAINYAQDEIETDLEVFVEANKADYFYSYGSFGVSGTGVLNEWMGFDEETVTNITYIDGQRFTVDNDLTSTFTAGTSAVVTNGGTFSASTTISGSEYNISYPGKTLVGLDDSRAAANLDGVYLEAYAPYGPLWDSDATVQGYMDDWVFLDGFVTQDVGLDGTYGIYGDGDTGRLSNLYTARGVVEKDYIKYDGMVPIMDVYAT
jgi:hypothetical protein